VARRATTARLTLGVIAIAVTTTAASPANAAGKQECIDAVGKAQSLKDEGKLLDARQQLLICSANTCPGPVRADCVLWLSDVEKVMPTVVPRAVDIKGVELADTALRIDGAVATLRLDARPIPVDPGSHVLRFEHPGYRPAEQTVVMKKGEKERVVTMMLERTAEAPPVGPAPPPATTTSERPVPVVSWIGWGVGAVGLIGFGVLGLKANLDYSSFKDSCGSNCTTADRDSLQSTMTIADISLIVGLVGAGVGTIFYLMRPTTSSSSELARAGR
jgi:hypothetical protein